MYLKITCVVLILQVLNIFALPYTHDYSDRDCHGLNCPAKTITCEKDSAVSEGRDVMVSVIKCKDKHGKMLLTKTITEPHEQKNGLIKVYTTSTVIEIKKLQIPHYT